MRTVEIGPETMGRNIVSSQARCLRQINAEPSPEGSK